MEKNVVVTRYSIFDFHNNRCLACFIIYFVREDTHSQMNQVIFSAKET